MAGIISGCVSRGSTILARVDGDLGDFNLRLDEILLRIARMNEERNSYKHGEYIISYILRSPGIITLSVATESLDQSIVFSFLENVSKKFIDHFRGTAMQAVAYSKNEEFGFVIENEMKRANDPNKVSDLHNQLDEVKQLMLKNVEDLLDRGEKLDCILVSTESLKDGARVFQYRARNVYNYEWYVS